MKKSQGAAPTPANRVTGIFFLVLFPILISLTGCGSIQKSESPESLGTVSGEYGSSEWVKKNGKNNPPSLDSAAIYCTTALDSFQKEYEWTVEQQFAFGDACASAFAKGLW